MTYRPKFWEFFAGAGLVRLALEPTWECTWANDIDARKADVYQANFGSRELVVRDVAAVNTNELPAPAAMAWASFPCQDLSLAGWRRGMTASRSGTFWPFWRLLHSLIMEGNRPPIVVIENVTGLLYGDNFKGLCEALAALDLQFGAVVIDGRYFVPQSRPRAFIVAVDANVPVQPWTRASAVSWTTPTSLRRAYGGLDKALLTRWRWWHLPEPTRPVLPLGSLLELAPSGVGWHSQDDTQHLLDLMTQPALLETRRRSFAETVSVGMLYRRTREGHQRAEVRWDGIAGCLRTPEGGSSRQTVLIAGKGLILSRLLSPREAARLMGVPDDYVLPEKYNDAYRAMGDGVVVPAVQWLNMNLLSPLAAAVADSSFSRVPARTSKFSARAFRQAERWEAVNGTR